MLSTSNQPTIEEIVENFSLLDEWDDRYRYVIELGRGLAPLDENDRTETNKVRGCTSQVWLATVVDHDDRGPVLSFIGDSDAHIVRGLVAILLALYSGRHTEEILPRTPSPCSNAWDCGSTSHRSAPTASARWWNASARMPEQRVPLAEIHSRSRRVGKAKRAHV